jgi:hypothetical protein
MVLLWYLTFQDVHEMTRCCLLLSSRSVYPLLLFLQALILPTPTAHLHAPPATLTCCIAVHLAIKHHPDAAITLNDLVHLSLDIDEPAAGTPLACWAHTLRFANGGFPGSAVATSTP